MFGWWESVWMRTMIGLDRCPGSLTAPNKLQAVRWALATTGIKISWRRPSRFRPASFIAFLYGNYGFRLRVWNGQFGRLGIDESADMHTNSYC